MLGIILKYVWMIIYKRFRGSTCAIIDVGEAQKFEASSECMGNLSPPFRQLHIPTVVEHQYQSIGT